MRLNKALLFCLCLTLAWVVPTSAQDFRGRINGTVTDNTGAVLPGVTVTVSSPALIQPQVQVTGVDQGCEQRDAAWPLRQPGEDHAIECPRFR